ncbi:phosphate-starvation-inducible PsiE family protein [Marinobacter sp. TBZ242]|uniref:Protein PsiE n=1 Tax=Marinobacter azerbaijanicus TaxID=3050455 RepID=A0ABT7IEV9_9GAMM|nr:phosphate-starvation-inducible PsiE family protein [Marinobacter sp. TBZ242]MDL0432670.1 phosphate-starvation-inducible PsiE family protein [Marinobacter sp. TBZ242]
MHDSGLDRDRPIQDEKPIKPDAAGMSHMEEAIAEKGFRVVEKLLLILTALLTIVAAGMEIMAVYRSGTVELADILLMFLYTEVIAMVAVFYTGKGSPFIYPIFIAITAIARLIVLQGKDMNPVNILYEAGAVVLLAGAAMFILRIPKR